MSNIDLKNGISLIKESINNIPHKPGIYQFLDKKEQVLYIGKAKNLFKRVSQYSNISNLPYRLKMMISMLSKITTVITSNETEALLLESNLIKSLKPKFNIALKDDKSFPYITIDENHNFPRIAKYRGKIRKGIAYYGPFPDAKKISLTIKELQKIFMIRPCTDNYFANRTRPCIQYQIKKCSGPCVGKINLEDYKNNVKKLKQFLSGKNIEVKNHFIEEMKRESNNLNFEKAAQIRDKIQLISYVQSKNITKMNGVKDVDIFATYVDQNSGQCCIHIFFIRNDLNCGDKTYFFDNADTGEISNILHSFIIQFYKINIVPQEIWLGDYIENTMILSDAIYKISGNHSKISSPKRGVKAEILNWATENAKESLKRKQKEQIKNIKILTELKNQFNLRKIPKLIEVYDNSHISGKFAVGCLIMAGQEGFIKKHYRTYKIKNNQPTSGGDDYSMLKEVLARRYKKLLIKDYPDLIIIDGGKGQLSAAKEILLQLNISEIDIIAMSKGVNRNAGLEIFHLINGNHFRLPYASNVLHYLQILRDEAHRFAITTHRKLRAKSLTKSTIDSIPGISEKRKKLLLNYFGSLNKVKAANKKDIEQVKGIGKKYASLIYEYLHTK